MIRRRLSSTKRSKHVSPEPRRRRILRTPSPAIPSEERGDDLVAAHRDSFRAEQVRLRDAIRRAIGGDALPLAHESLGNMSGRRRRRVQRLLDHRLAGQ